MLQYWYSERCTRQIKLVISILTIAVTLYFSEISKLSTTLTLFSLLLGLSVHLLYCAYLKIQLDYSHRPILKILFAIIPWIAGLILFLRLPDLGKIAQAVQILGFSLIGFYIVSMYGNRAPRNSS